MYMDVKMLRHGLRKFTYVQFHSPQIAYKLELVDKKIISDLKAEQKCSFRNS